MCREMKFPFQDPEWKKWGLCISSPDFMAWVLWDHDQVANFLNNNLQAGLDYLADKMCYRQVLCLAKGIEWDGRT